MQMQMKKKTVWTVVGMLGGFAALGFGAYLVWNSKQARMARAAKRTGRLLYKAGSVLQSVSGLTE